MKKLSLNIAAVGCVDSSYGIAVAAAKHVELLKKIARVELCGEGRQAPAGAVVYHHAQAPATPPEWYAGKRVVGYWVVESSLAAASFKASADACAQIWTCSEASAAAVRALGSTTPVYVIPHPVPAPAVMLDRRGRKTVTTLFAFAPGWSRKNPEAVFRVWRAAFDADKNARLIVKARNCGEGHKARLIELAAADVRIELIFGDHDMSALYERADIFLSMQHAGAFELHIAEAAASGLPIVCTAVGGPLDYLKNRGAFLIGGSVIPPGHMDDELNRAGGWIKPDETAATAAMMALGNDSDMRRRMGIAARKNVMELLNEQRITEMMQAALQQLPKRAVSGKGAAPVKPIRDHGPAPRMSLPSTPGLWPIRTGLELESAKHGHVVRSVPAIVSHRRSGTHLLGAVLRRHWGCDWLKSHDFPERLPRGHASVYVLRNPFDALFATWSWWRTGGGACNAEIAAIMDTISFGDWLGGNAGERFGFQSWRLGVWDNFEVTRGQMYDPIRYWRDHWRAAAEAGMLIVTYEDLVRKPATLTHSLSRRLFNGRPPEREVMAITEPVGLQPGDKVKPIGYAKAEWPGWAQAKLRFLLNQDLLQSAGVRTLEEWVSGLEQH